MMGVAVVAAAVVSIIIVVISITLIGAFTWVCIIFIF